MPVDSGSTTGTPIAPGVGAGAGGLPLPYTLLSLGRFAQLLGIAPMHFWGATAASISPAVFPASASCGSIWPQHDWQNSDQTSRESVAYAILDAERQLSEALGYYPAPWWIANEIQPYPRDFYRESMYQVLDVRAFRKSQTLRFGKLISGGRRAVTLVGTATTGGGSLAYSDDDGDGYAEIATITLNTTLTDACEIKVYHASHDGVQEWEVRPIRSIDITAGVLTITLDSWLLIDPSLYEEYPTDEGFEAIDVSTTANFVTSVDVYREYNDTSLASAVFHWENAEPAGCICSYCLGAGCEACSDTTQDGCMQIRDSDLAKVVPIPATYADGTWTSATFDVCRAPDRVAYWYRAGAVSNDFERGRTCDPLSTELAWMIIWLTIPKLERPPCGCARLNNMFEYLGRDVSENIDNGSNFFKIDSDLNNPFGTHIGEIMAWRRLHHMMPKKVHYAVL